MSKRFTDTEKWKKPFLRGLKAPYKLLWMYICDDCDHAGIWQVDMEVACLRIGEKIECKSAEKMFAEKIIIFDSGLKWFIPSFIEFQYPSGLNPNNKVHGSVLQILKKYNLLKVENKPLESPIQGAKDKDKDKDKEQDMDIIRELSENEIKNCIEFLVHTTQKTLNENDVLGYWKAFLIHSPDKYPNQSERKKHFRNWIKKEIQNGTNLKSIAGAKQGISEKRSTAIANWGSELTGK